MHFIKEAEEAILAQKRAEEEAEVTRMYDSLYQMLINLSIYINMHVHAFISWWNE
jgi:hypothetical protein